jgi:hypothetical protein
MNAKSLIFFAILPTLSCQQETAPWSEAEVVSRLDQTIGGTKAIAQVGDIMLQNDQLRVAILSTRNSMGPGLFGGSIVDADLQRSDPAYLHGNGLDQFAELFPTASLNVAMPVEVDDVKIIEDGKDGGDAVVAVSASAEPFLSMLGTLWAIVGSPDISMYTEYRLKPAESWVRITTVATVAGVSDDPIGDMEPANYYTENMPVIDLVLEKPVGLVLGDFYLSGGSVDVFAPGMGFDEDGAVFEAQQRGENIFTNPFQFDFVASVGDGVSYGIAASQGDSFVPMFTSSQTIVVGAGVDSKGKDDVLEGRSFGYERFFFVGHGDVGSIVDSYVVAREIPHGFVSGYVHEKGQGQPLSGVDVLVFELGAEKPWSQWKTDVRLDDHLMDGSFGGALPVGEWEVLVHSPDRPDSERVAITVVEGEEQMLSLEGGRGGELTFSISDDTGRRIPAKVSIFPIDPSDLQRNPVYGDGFIAGGPEAVVFPMYGVGEVALPPGEYYAIASRGLEYELDQSEPFVIDATRSQHLDFVVTRSIDTQGWVSADFHVHAAPSHDSGVMLADRVRTMVCEGVEFFSSTDHDYITDYAPTVELLGMEEWVQTAIGEEVTTLEVGHFLGFPLKHDFSVEGGGAMDWTNSAPADIVQYMRDESEGDPVVFVGHPRDGLLGYFDQYGFDQYSGTVDNLTVVTPILSLANGLLSAANFTTDFEAIEVLNGKRFELLRTPLQTELDDYADDGSVSAYQMMERTLDEQEALRGGASLGYGIDGQIDDWFSLLNLGKRYTALGNSDTHGWTSTEAGCPRNYVLSDTDQPAYIDDQAMADAVRDHRVIASYGPFVQMWVDGEMIGSDVTMTGESVTVDIEVQAPSWVVVDRVELYANGELIREWTVEPGGGVVPFSERFDVELEEDAWLVTIVMGDGDLGPVFSPIEVPYVDLQMVVEEALGGVDLVSSMLVPAAPLPRVHPVHPFALTNPIWVDTDGDGFTAPGLPSWLSAPEAPTSK